MPVGWQRGPLCFLGPSSARGMATALCLLTDGNCVFMQKARPVALSACVMTAFSRAATVIGVL